MAELVVLDDFSLIDGTGGAPVPGARVVIEEGVIVSVGEGSAPRPGRATVIEGGDRWLLPGLWDTHIHHAFSAGGLVSAE